MSLDLRLGDCIEVMRQMPEASVDAVVTDPPYELGFMGREWDATGIAYSVEMWREVLRVLKPGGHLVAFGGARTFPEMAVAIRQAGFERRDTLCWLYAAGFPKSLNLHGEWEGWGTALKPAYEPIVLARKPLDGTVAANVLKWGTGGLNIEGCRIGTEERINPPFGVDGWRALEGRADKQFPSERAVAGRWPANLILSCSCERAHEDECPVLLLDAQSGERAAGGNLTGEEPSRPFDVTYGVMDGRREWHSIGDRGGAARFFFTAKTTRSEREAGLEHLEPVRRSDGRVKDIENPRLRTNERRNHHPTVKPVALMRWLCRLVTPPGGVILDPFLGSGTTGMAALDEGFRFVGIEREAEYLEIARARIEHRHLLGSAPAALTAGEQARLL